ncbi:hypothetical protein HZH66_004816 [Vespula vulgaris]|uniref:Uncharacterized protein n=1 Tax=Vespula vulgaris TaxID=7454 RepID=A0A834K8S4_VESVU|nr:hypothetical protein HZH66_004816 [Vespula vulgaris]
MRLSQTRSNVTPSRDSKEHVRTSRPNVYVVLSSSARRFFGGKKLSRVPILTPSLLVQSQSQKDINTLELQLSTTFDITADIYKIEYTFNTTYPRREERDENKERKCANAWL